MLKLLIVGATGLVGGKALKLALEDARVSSVVVLSRRPVKPHPKLENYVTDFDALPLDAPFWKVDAALCALGTTRRENSSKSQYYKIDVEYPSVIAAQVKKHGATSFVLVSSLGASLKSPFSYLKMKGEAEAKLEKIGFKSLTIVRPSFIAGEREKPRTMENCLFSIFRVLDPLMPKRLRAVSADKIAKAMLESVVMPKPGVTIKESETL